MNSLLPVWEQIVQFLWHSWVGQLLEYLKKIITFLILFVWNLCPTQLILVWAKFWEQIGYSWLSLIERPPWKCMLTYIEKIVFLYIKVIRQKIIRWIVTQYSFPIHGSLCCINYSNYGISLTMISFTQSFVSAVDDTQWGVY